MKRRKVCSEKAKFHFSLQQCDTWMMTFSKRDLAAGNPEYTKVSIGIPEEENRLDIGEYIVVIYY